MMVYCKLLNKNGTESATYAFGPAELAMTGKITFFSNGDNPVVEKEPEKKVSLLWMRKLFAKYRDSILKGEFAEKMAYEC